MLEAKRDTYVEAGYAAADSYDGNITSKVIASVNINTNAVSTGNVTYTVSDAAHNTATTTRSVSVVDTTPPTITLNGDISVYVLSNTTFIDPKATSIDLVDGNLTTGILIIVSPNISSSYVITYKSTDKSNNTAYAYRYISIVTVNSAPNISLVGAASITLAATRTATAFADPGAVAFAWNGASLTNKIVTVWYPSTVNYSRPGLYNGNYSVTDSNYTSSVIRQVVVSDLVAPTLTLAGLGTIIVEGGTNFTDPGVTYSDNLDTNATLGTLLVVTGAAINVYSPDGTSSTIVYSLHDTSGNYAPSVTRTVTIIDTTPPTISLLGNATVIVEAATSYTDAGATAADLHDITDTVVMTGAVDLKPASTPAVYSLVYNSHDAAGNAATPQTRSVTVVDTTPPVMTLYSPADVTVEVFSFFTANITAVDRLDGVLTPSMATALTVNNCSSIGVFTVTYTSQDKAGNAAPPIVVTVRVVDTIPPVVTPVNGSFYALQGGTYFVYRGATATDNYDGNVTSKIVQVGLYQFSPATIAALFNATPPLLSSPDWSMYPISFFSSYSAPQVLTFTNVGTLYVYVFSCTDASNNTGYGYRTVSLIDTWVPIIYLLTPNVDTLEGQKYPGPVTSNAVGAIAQDIHDGVIVNVGSVVSSSLGGVGGFSMISSDAPIGTVFTVTYFVSDQAGNQAANVTQTITVVDTVPPVLTMQGPLNDTVESGVVLPGDVFTATSFDEYDGNLTSSIVVTFDGPGAVLGNATSGYIFNISGVYEMHFTSTDVSGNTGTENRTIEVLPAPGHSSGNAGSITIIGAVLGAVGGIILIAVAFFIYGAAERSRKRRRIEQARLSVKPPERRMSYMNSAGTLSLLPILSTSSYGSQIWYHGLIQRDEAEKRLTDEGLKESSYLVRAKDLQETTFTLSLIHKKRPFHFLIAKIDDQLLFQGQDVTNSWGSNLVAVIEYLQEHKGSGVPSLLLHPVPVPNHEAVARSTINAAYEDTTFESDVDGNIVSNFATGPGAPDYGYAYASQPGDSSSDYAEASVQPVPGYSIPNHKKGIALTPGYSSPNSSKASSKVIDTNTYEYNGSEAVPGAYLEPHGSQFGEYSEPSFVNQSTEYQLASPTGPSEYSFASPQNLAGPEYATASQIQSSEPTYYSQSAGSPALYQMPAQANVTYAVASQVDSGPGYAAIALNQSHFEPIYYSQNTSTEVPAYQIPQHQISDSHYSIATNLPAEQPSYQVPERDLGGYAQPGQAGHTDESGYTPFSMQGQLSEQYAVASSQQYEYLPIDAVSSAEQGPVYAQAGGYIDL